MEEVPLACVPSPALHFYYTKNRNSVGHLNFTKIKIEVNSQPQNSYGIEVYLK